MSTQGSGNFHNDGNAYNDHGVKGRGDPKASSFASIESEMWDEVLSCFDDEDDPYYLDDDSSDIGLSDYSDPIHDGDYWEDFNDDMDTFLEKYGEVAGIDKGLELVEKLRQPQ